ncbi:MAG: EamA family transporter [Patescibacteria group bacterium]|nr:EamA family transporter [Patescibacteria group bacterium]
MNWLFLTIISYLMLALVNLGDKFVIDKLLKSSKAYAFSIGVLGSLVFLAAPWFLEWPGFLLLLINFLAGAFFVFALWLMYEALKQGEASRVVIVIGGIIPIFTITFSVFFLKEQFSSHQWLGFLLLIVGTLIISFIVSKKKKFLIFIEKLKLLFKGNYKKKWIILSIVAALFYSLFFITTKHAYEQQSFLSSFLWIRLGGLFVSLLFLIDKDSRKEIIKSFTKKSKNKAKIGKGFVVINQALGSLAFIIQNYAIYLGPVALINALQGIQYAFLLIIGIFFSLFFPKVLKEDISQKTLFKKVLAILIIGFGLYFITI